jgi:hypothetical protein
MQKTLFILTVFRKCIWKDHKEIKGRRKERKRKIKIGECIKRESRRLGNLGNYIDRYISFKIGKYN